jgi:virginiamycin B lyase
VIPLGIAAGSDGNVWVCDPNPATSGRIGRVTPSGETTFYPLHTDGGYPVWIAKGADGNVWFTEEMGSRIGRITSSGVVDEFDVPTPQATPNGITLGPDGHIWFVEGADKIGRVDSVD